MRCLEINKTAYISYFQFFLIFIFIFNYNNAGISIKVVFDKISSLMSWRMDQKSFNIAKIYIGINIFEFLYRFYGCLKLQPIVVQQIFIVNFQFASLFGNFSWQEQIYSFISIYKRSYSSSIRRNQFFFHLHICKLIWNEKNSWNVRNFSLIKT